MNIGGGVCVRAERGGSRGGHGGDERGGRADCPPAPSSPGRARSRVEPQDHGIATTCPRLGRRASLGLRCPDESVVENHTVSEVVLKADLSGGRWWDELGDWD